MDRRWVIAGLVALPAAGAYRMISRGERTLRTYEWYPTEAAPEDAPVLLLNGDLLLADGGTTYVPDHRMAGKGWGEVGSIDVVGDDLKVLPASVSLRWFSYLEDRFYAGEFTLPADRMEAVFAQGTPMPPPRSREPYRYLIFGMAPGGHVSVWACADRVVREIARFRASPTEVPWTEIIETPTPTRAEHIRQVLEQTQSAEQIALHRSPTWLALWDDYPRRLAWAPQLTGADPKGAILWLKGLNGERDWADLADPQRGGEPLPPTLPMPASMRLIWYAGGARHSAEIALDPVETVAAFRKLADSGRAGPMTLVVEPAGNAATVDVFLRRGELVYRFARKNVEVYGG